MKKIVLSVSVLLLTAMMILSCNSNSPKDVANTWLTSFYHMDYDAAKKLSTEDTRNLLSQLQQLSGMVPDSSKKELKKITVTVKDVKVDGDKAKATYTTSDNTGKEEVLNLVKQGDKWLVQFSKNDQMGGAGDNTSPDQPAGADSTAPSGPSPDADTTKH